jgi:DNA-binding transcriptional LysR family regulator
MAKQSTRVSRKLRRLLTFRQLEVLHAVAETQGVGSAADKLNLTQPSASMQLKKLSDHLGSPLYEVLGRKLNLTESGELAVAAAQDIFARLEQLEVDLNALQGLHAGTLRIGIVTSAEYFVPHILGPFCKAYPDIDVHLAVGNRREMNQRLADNLDDLYFFADQPELEQHEAVSVGANKLLVIASAKHPLAGRQSVQWQDLASDTVLLREEGSGSRRLLEKHLSSLGHSLPKYRVIASNEGIKHAVLAQLGIAVVSAHTLDHGANKNLVQLNVDDFPINSQWYLVSHRDKKFSVLAQAFREFLLHEGGEMLNERLAYWEQHRQPRLPRK